ncbi:hypothetical protein PANO111632_19700 [Paracoccus nototheniae]
MARLFTAQIAAQLAHPFDDIAIAHPGAHQRDATGGQMAFQPDIRHDRGDQRVLRQPASRMGAFGDDAHQLIAIDQPALFIDQMHPVGIAVQRDAQIGAMRQHRIDAGLRRGRSAARIDVDAVGFGADADHLGAQFPDQVGADPVGCAMRRIDDHAQPVQPQPARKGALGKLDIAFARAVDAAGVADLGGRGQIAVMVHPGLDRGLVGIRQLIAVGAKELDPVIPMRIVRGRDHHPQIGAQRPGQHADGGGGQRAGQDHVHPRRGEPRHQRTFDHIARQPRVLADHHGARAARADQMAPGGPAKPHHHLGQDGPGIGAPAHPVGSEQSVGHDVKSLAEDAPGQGVRPE